MTLDANHISDEFIECLRKFHDEGRDREAHGLLNYFNRFNNALQMSPKSPAQGAE